MCRHMHRARSLLSGGNSLKQMHDRSRSRGPPVADDQLALKLQGKGSLYQRQLVPEAQNRGRICCQT